MADGKQSIAASCLCGQFKHQIAVQEKDLPLAVFACHCDSCRHVTGTLCDMVAIAPSTYQPSADLVKSLHPFRMNPYLTFLSCPKCGTPIFGRYQDPSQSDDQAGWGIPTGTLAQADGILEIQQHTWISATLDNGFSEWLQEVAGKPSKRQMEGAVSEEVPSPFWRSPSRRVPMPSPTDRLHAHCKCGGVSFYISRPSEHSAQNKAAWPDLLVPFGQGHEMPPEDEPWWLRANNTKFLAGVCACDSCRLACGMEWVEWAFIPTSDITLDADGKVPFTRTFGTLKSYESSPGAHRYFCGECAATVFWDGDWRRDIIDVAVGLLDAPEGARAESWLDWCTTRVSFREDTVKRSISLTLAVEDGLKQYAERQARAGEEASRG